MQNLNSPAHAHLKQSKEIGGTQENEVLPLEKKTAKLGVQMLGAE